MQEKSRRSERKNQDFSICKNTSFYLNLAAII